MKYCVLCCRIRFERVELTIIWWKWICIPSAKATGPKTDRKTHIERVEVSQNCRSKRSLQTDPAVGFVCLWHMPSVVIEVTDNLIPHVCDNNDLGRVDSSRYDEYNSADTTTHQQDSQPASLPLNLYNISLQEFVDLFWLVIISVMLPVAAHADNYDYLCYFCQSSHTHVHFSRVIHSICSMLLCITYANIRHTRAARHSNRDYVQIVPSIVLHRTGILMLVCVCVCVLYWCSPDVYQCRRRFTSERRRVYNYQTASSTFCSNAVDDAGLIKTVQIRWTFMCDANARVKCL